MKKQFVTPLIVVLVILAVFTIAVANGGSKGERLYRKAVKLEQKADYLKAFDAYKTAKTALVKEKKIKLATKCRDNMTRMEKIRLTYTFTQEAVISRIQKAYPKISKQRINKVIKEGRLPHMKIGGTIYYFSDFPNTLFHLYPDFRVKPQGSAIGQVEGFLKTMNAYIYEKQHDPNGRTLFKPINYIADGSMTLPRNKLPKTGTLKVWVPLPLTNAAQTNVNIISVYPEKYVRYPLKLDGDIAFAYMEIPLKEIKSDLKIGSKFKFTHYEERYNVVPSKVGKYDKNSALYIRYTSPARNIALTPAIKAKAKQLAGKETNPYLIAKKFYDHIVYDLDYSFTPHAALEALNIPESVYVHEHGYGDCGAQSMYFAALCRSMGIPARAAGGMQLFPIGENGCGDHFWAQIYLPNYGWMPVDTSVGQLVKYMDVSDKERKDFIEYFYSKMEPFRYLIQVDVDQPLAPPADEELSFKAVLQEPAFVCSEMDVNPGIVFMEAWKIKVKQVK